MKITGENSVKGADKARTQQKKKLEVQEEPRSGESNRAVEVEKASKVKLQLSPQEIQRIKNRLDSLPEVDEARVAKIKKALEDGSFRINYDRIADKLIEEAQQIQSFVDKVRS